MGDRDKGEPTIELIEIESLFQSTLELLMPGARREFRKNSLEPSALLQVRVLVVVVVLASSARATVPFLLLVRMQKRHLQNHNSNVLLLRMKEPGKNCHDCLSESPCASLKDPPGSPVPQVSL